MIQDRARLVRDNYNEQIFNRLFTSLRDYDDYGSAIEASSALQESIIGLAIYRDDLTSLYSWGKTPSQFDENILHHSREARNNRYTIGDQKNRSIQFIMNIERRTPRMQGRQENHHGMRGEEPSRNFFFNSLDAGKYFYIDIFQPDYWRTIHLARIIFPICIFALFFFIFYIRNLFLKNIEYRKKIEDQKNLVVLGTAASTLAHEIKNPLLSIRLQTGILRKLFFNNGKEEIAADEIRIVEEEVERISALVYRVNDYLRDAVGNPVSLDIKNLLQETFHRLSGMNIITHDDEKNYFVFIDADRTRSVFENIIRNALESGGDQKNITCTIFKNGNHIVIEMKDQGKGISKSNMMRIFDPFFTSKSTGTGIGLSISKRFVEAAKGTITLESKENAGTLVRIIFPEYIN
jgi:two-component system sensor histidine kinase HydH